MDTYSNGLNYVPYQSKRNSKRLSEGEFIHTEPRSIAQDAAGQSPGAWSAVTCAPIGTAHLSANPALTPQESRPIIAGPSSSTATFRRLGPKQPFSQPESPSLIRPRSVVHSPTIHSRPTLLVLDSEPTLRPLDSSVRERKPAAQPGSPAGPMPHPSVMNSGPPAQRTASGSRRFSPANSPLATLPVLPADNTAPPSPIPLTPTLSLRASSPSEHKGSTAASPRVNASPAPRSSSPSPIPAPPLLAPATLPAWKAPYRQGFQPKGAYRVLTDEFLSARNRRTDGQRGEERRLERRLEKLINLHFPLESSVPEPNARPLPTSRRSSPFAFYGLGGKSPGGLLRAVVEPKPGTPAALRVAEQIITPWQEDAAATLCPHCQASFHPITNRKHHCRLCGRVVCALPPKRPNRLKPCSLLVTADRQTGRIIPVPETIAYGVTRRPPLDAASSSASVNSHEDVTPKSFRVCKECNAIISRKELNYEANTPTAFTRLHDLLLHIESDIETYLANLEAALPSAHLQPLSYELQLLRKQLTGLFSEYDAVAKRIRTLPCAIPTSRGVEAQMEVVSAQERVQQAVWARALNFMQMHVGLLQRIPKPPAHKSSKASSQPQALSEKVAMDQYAATAHSLQPLLEQEALLESFIQEANAQRKFEDVKSLKANLAEIRGEIDKIVAASNLKAW